MNAIVMSVIKDQSSALAATARSVSLGEPNTEQVVTEVPLKPTAAMLAAGSRAGGVSVETAWKIYLAMIKEAA